MKAAMGSVLGGVNGVVEADDYACEKWGRTPRHHQGRSRREEGREI
jgi:hypothetical protein